jgi:hypothetical protein
VISAKPYIESFLRARDSSFVSDSFEGLDRPAAVWASDDPSSYLGRTYGSPDGRRPWPSCRVCVLRGRSWLCCPGCAVRVHVRDDGSRWTPESVTAAQASGQAPLTWHVSGSPTSSTVRNLHLHSRSERYRPFPNRGRRASRVADVDTIAHPTNPSTCPRHLRPYSADRSSIAIQMRAVRGQMRALPWASCDIVLTGPAYIWSADSSVPRACGQRAPVPARGQGRRSRPQSSSVRKMVVGTRGDRLASKDAC